jgi:hypothetical protein
MMAPIYPLLGPGSSSTCTKQPKCQDVHQIQIHPGKHSIEYTYDHHVSVLARNRHDARPLHVRTRYWTLTDQQIQLKSENGFETNP